MRALVLIAVMLGACPAAAEDAADPFAADRPMSDAELASARGGLAVGGFVFDFSMQTLVTVEGAIDPSAALAPMAVAFDPAVNAIVINNALDGVSITRIVSLDVAVPNFTPALSGAQAATAGADLAAMLLTLGSF